MYGSMCMIAMAGGRAYPSSGFLRRRCSGHTIDSRRVEMGLFGIAVGFARGLAIDRGWDSPGALLYVRMMFMMPGVRGDAESRQLLDSAGVSIQARVASKEAGAP
jgi:hypothetical protein